MFPSPPAILVPPMTAAVIALPSACRPSVGVETPNLEVERTPATAASNAEITYKAIFVFLTLIPASSAALALLPIKYTFAKTLFSSKGTDI